MCLRGFQIRLANNRHTKLNTNWSIAFVTVLYSLHSSTQAGQGSKDQQPNLI